MALNTTESPLELVDDLWVDILLRLPLKPLLRFKSVSKKWNSLISDPNFHHARNRKRLLINPAIAAGVIVRSRDAPQIPDDHPFVSPTAIVSFDKSIARLEGLCTGPWLLSSCNGLLLCISLDRTYYVCNPTTHKLFKLPESEDADAGNRRAGMCLAFDPYNSPHYSVVCVWELDRNAPSGLYQFEVFSSQTGCWRKCGKPFKARPEFMTCAQFSRGVCWNGAVHWVRVLFGKSIYFDPNDHGDYPNVMPSPPPRNNFRSTRTGAYFGESCGRLNFIDDGYQCDMEFSVHEMREDYSEWFVKYKVIISTISISANFFSIWAVVRGKKNEDSFLVLQVGRSVVRHNLVDNTSETIFEFETDEFETLNPLWLPFQYIESLFSV